MPDIRWISPEFAVAPQLSPADLAGLAAAGVRTLLVNRPDGEEPGQPSGAEMRTAAEALGLAFHAIPFAGNPPPKAVSDTAALLEAASAPVLAYCRSGRRSIMAWAMAQALTGERRPNEIIAAAKGAGFDIEGAREALEALAPRA